MYIFLSSRIQLNISYPRKTLYKLWRGGSGVACSMTGPYFDPHHGNFGNNRRLRWTMLTSHMWWIQEISDNRGDIGLLGDTS